MNENECKNRHKQYRGEDGCFPDFCPQCCESCWGFGYTKGSARGPWDKAECEACVGTGKRPQ